MPSHHRVKNVAYDDEDDYYESEEEYYEEYNDAPAKQQPSSSAAIDLDPSNPSNSLTDEDRSSLRDGTTEVRQLLAALDGEATNDAIGDPEVWEALWEYYYDIDASVGWLREKARKKREAEEKRVQALQQAKEKEKERAKATAAKQKKPSPDDVVKNAQAGAKGFKGATKATGKDVTAGMKQLHLGKDQQQPPPPPPVKIKHKGLDVPAEYARAKQAGQRKKNAANFVVIGHVDAGKSTLMGRLLLDLNAVSQRQYSKQQTESANTGKNTFALAWTLDSTAEERARGVTIDVASTHFSTNSTVYTLLDAPGHRDFVPNMIAGAALADFAVLVIDAGVGGFEKGLKGQTKEHALLVRSLGVRKVVVAVNKMDVSSGGGTDGGWSKDRFEEIQQQTLAFLTSTVGFAAQNVVFVPCSGWRGQNVIARRSPSAEDEGKDTGKMPEWYQGPSLVDVLEEVSSEISAARDVETAIKRDLRMTIVDVFRGGLQNPLSIAGRLDSGHLQIGDRVCAQPTGATAVVKGIDVEGLVAANANEDAPDTAAEWCVAGDNVVLHLANLESPSTGANAKEADPSSQLRAGDILCPPGKPIENTSVFTAKVLTFAHMTPMHVAVHRGRLSVPASVARLVAVLDKGSNEVVKRRPKIVQPGSLVRVQVACEVSAPLEKGGRVVLRAEGETIAAGLIE